MKANGLSDYENSLLENGERKAINDYNRKYIQNTINLCVEAHTLYKLKRNWLINRNNLYTACVKLGWFDITLSQRIKSSIIVRFFKEVWFGFIDENY